MKQLTRISIQGTCLTLVLGLGALGVGTAQAESRLDGVQVQGAFDSTTTKYHGTVNRVPSDGQSIIIDDTLLNLDNVVMVNGQSWSRERLAGKLEENVQVAFELKQGPTGQLPVIVSINVRR